MFGDLSTFVGDQLPAFQSVTPVTSCELLWQIQKFLANRFFTLFLLHYVHSRIKTVMLHHSGQGNGSPLHLAGVCGFSDHTCNHLCEVPLM